MFTHLYIKDSTRMIQVCFEVFSDTENIFELKVSDYRMGDYPLPYVVQVFSREDIWYLAESMKRENETVEKYGER